LLRVCSDYYARGPASCYSGQALQSKSLMQARMAEKYSQLLADGARYASKQDWLGAARTYREAITLEPDEPKAYLNLGAVLIHSGNDVEGVQLYLEAKARLPEDSEAWGKATAEAFETLKLVDASRAAIKPEWWNDAGLMELSARVAKAAPNYCAAIGMRAEVLSGLGGEAWGGQRRSATDFSKAANHFEQAASLHPARAMKAELAKLADQCRRECVALTT
jgi:tetratricopeptide (TPR) repeat protein